MKWLLGVYTKRFNARHRIFGHLFSGRYKALLVDGSGNGYLKTVCDYVHLNPVCAGLLSREQRLKSYPWSSFPLYAAAGPKPAWLRIDRLRGEWRIAWNQSGAGRRFEAVLEARRQAELEQEFQPLRRGWCIGSDAFRAEMLEYIESQSGTWHYGSELRQSGEAKAERLIQEAMTANELTLEHLAVWRQRASVQAGARTPLTRADNHDGRMDRPTAAHGSQGPPDAFALQAWQTVRTFR